MPDVSRIDIPYGDSAALERIRALVDEQAENEALWSIYPFGEQPIMEAYLQQELRRLHALVEEETAEILS